MRCLSLRFGFFCAFFFEDEHFFYHTYLPTIHPLGSHTVLVFFRAVFCFLPFFYNDRFNPYTRYTHHTYITACGLLAAFVFLLSSLAPAQNF